MATDASATKITGEYSYTAFEPVFKDVNDDNATDLTNATYVVFPSDGVISGVEAGSTLTDNSVNVGDAVSIFGPLTFDPALVVANPFITFEGFSFQLTELTQGLTTATLINFTGMGILSHTDPDLEDTEYTFSANGTTAGGATFTFGGSSNSVPDGGSTLALFGFVLVSIPLVRRKLRA